MRMTIFLGIDVGLTGGAAYHSFQTLVVNHG